MPETVAVHFIDRAELARRLGVSKSTTKRMQLPKPYRMAARALRWDWREVEEWLKHRYR